MSPARLVVIVGPSGVGKGTVVRRLIDRYPAVALSVSATTRPPRDGEENGVHYHFISEDEFTRRVAAGDFLEWATVHGRHRYGTLRNTVREMTGRGATVILEIDLDGARQVRESGEPAQFIFLAPPSWEELERRLSGRGTETDEQIARRLETARTEMAAANEFDHVVVNDEVDRTVSQLADLMGLA